MFLAIVNSTIANANAGVNVSSRTAFAMGRIGAFPRVPGADASRAPVAVVAIVTGFVITVAVTLGLGLGYDPITAFVMVATGIVILLVAIYILVNAACIGYFARRGQRLQRVPAPDHPDPRDRRVRAGVAHLGGPAVFSFVPPLTAPFSYVGPGVGGFMIVGLIYLVYLYQRHPERVAEVGRVHLDPLEEYPS